jgi:hypothetical protein
LLAGAIRVRAFKLGARGDDADAGYWRSTPMPLFVLLIVAIVVVAVVLGIVVLVKVLGPGDG